MMINNQLDKLPQNEGEHSHCRAGGQALKSYRLFSSTKQKWAAKD